MVLVNSFTRMDESQASQGWIGDRAERNVGKKPGKKKRAAVRAASCCREQGHQGYSQGSLVSTGGDCKCTLGLLGIVPGLVVRQAS